MLCKIWWNISKNIERIRNVANKLWPTRKGMDVIIVVSAMSGDGQADQSCQRDCKFLMNGTYVLIQQEQDFGLLAIT
jgi:hypothetical protein